MTIDAISSTSLLQPANSNTQRTQPASTNTAQLLGISSSELSSDLQSGMTLGQLAQEKGVSSTDLLASVEKDLQANAPQGAPSLSSNRLEQIAANIINGTGPGGQAAGGQGAAAGSGGPPPLSLTNTAQLLGISSSELSSDLQSGMTLAQLAQEKGVSSSDLLSSVEKDMQANAPQGAPSLTSDQLQQMATDIINGTPPSSSSTTASSNLDSLANATGIDSTTLLQALSSSGGELSQLLNNPAETGYGTTIAGAITGGVAVDEYA